MILWHPTLQHLYFWFSVLEIGFVVEPHFFFTSCDWHIIRAWLEERDILHNTSSRENLPQTRNSCGLGLTGKEGQNENRWHVEKQPYEINVKAGREIRCLLQCSPPSGVLCAPWGFVELTICTPTPSEIPCHPRGHLRAALPTEGDKSQPTVLLRLQLKCEIRAVSSQGDTWDLSVLRRRVSDSADISNNPAPDAVCSSWCHVKIIAELHHRNPEVLIKYMLVHDYKPKYDQDL